MHGHSLDTASALIGSALSGVLSRLVCHPLDTLKSKLQYDNGSSFSGTLDALYKTYASDGIRGFYRGLGVAIIGGAPGVCLYLSSYDTCKDLLIKNSYFMAANPFVSYLCSGMIAEACSCLVFVPVDVIKERLQVKIRISSSFAPSNKETAPMYRGSYDAMRQIFRHEGLKGLYKGYGVTLLAYGPFSAIYFLSYEYLKKAVVDRRSSSSDPSFGEALLCSAAAGAFASFTTNPLDLVKLRMQVHRGQLKGQQVTLDERRYQNMLSSFRTILSEEGYTGFFRGSTARILFHIPNVAITMSGYEWCKNYCKKVLAD